MATTTTTTTTYTINNTTAANPLFGMPPAPRTTPAPPLAYTSNHAVQYDTYDYLCKMLVIGDSGCGKSSLLTRFSDDEFNTGYASTIGVDFLVRTIDVGAKRVKLQMWDTAGQERFRTITTSYYRGAHAVLIVFDVTQEDSFRNVKRWVSELETINAGAIGQTATQVMLVANKVDLTRQRVVESHRIEELAQELHIPFIETSAKTNLNVQEAFTKIASSFVRQRMREESEGRWHKGEKRDVPGGMRLDQGDEDDASFWKKCFGACAIM